MGRDKRNIERGKCSNCDCEEYEVVEKHHILCDYCGHPPMFHIEKELGKEPTQNKLRPEYGPGEQEIEEQQTKDEMHRPQAHTSPGHIEGKMTETTESLCGPGSVECSETKTEIELDEPEEIEQETFDTKELQRADTTKATDSHETEQVECETVNNEELQKDSKMHSVQECADTTEATLEGRKERKKTIEDSDEPEKEERETVGAEKVRRDSKTHGQQPSERQPEDEKEFIAHSNELNTITSCAIVICQNWTHKVKCLPCSTIMEIGKTNKWSNVKRHMNSAAHHVLLQIHFTGRKILSSFSDRVPRHICSKRKLSSMRSL